MPTPDDFRRIALGMKDALESAHMGHPDFRVHGKIFATLHADHQWGMVKLTPDEQQMFVRDHPAAFKPENGAWGRQGCTAVRLDSVDEDVLGEAMTLAWRSAAKSPPGGGRRMTRRSVLRGALATAAVATARPLLAVQPSTSFRGSKAGEEREVYAIKLCWCPPGRFVMGSPRGEPERRPGEDQVEVTLTRGFWMATYEATQGQWKRVVGLLPGDLTAELPAGDDFPVGNVNFAEAEAFCRTLTELGRQSGVLPQDWEFRLPTEAQWEYACRAGTTTATAFGDKLGSKQANFKGKSYNGAEQGPSLGRAARVGSYPANAWGLHDMHGNTYEWCRDWYHARLPGGTDPDLYAAKSSATRSEHGDISRVRRGGCWADEGWPCRSAFRLRFEPERRYDHIGFRVVAVQP